MKFLFLIALITHCVHGQIAYSQDDKPELVTFEELYNSSTYIETIQKVISRNGINDIQIISEQSEVDNELLLEKIDFYIEKLFANNQLNELILFAKSFADMEGSDAFNEHKEIVYEAYKKAILLNLTTSTLVERLIIAILNFDNYQLSEGFVKDVVIVEGIYQRDLISKVIHYVKRHHDKSKNHQMLGLLWPIVKSVFGSEKTNSDAWAKIALELLNVKGSTGFGKNMAEAIYNTRKRSEAWKLVVRRIIDSSDQKVMTYFTNVFFTKENTERFEDLAIYFIKKISKNTILSFINTTLVLDHTSEWEKIVETLHRLDSKSFDKALVNTAYANKFPIQMKDLLNGNKPKRDNIYSDEIKLDIKNGQIIEFQNGPTVTVLSFIYAGNNVKVYKVVDLNNSQNILSLRVSNTNETNFERYKKRAMRLERVNQNNDHYTDYAQVGKNYLLSKWVEGISVTEWFYNWNKFGRNTTDIQYIKLKEFISSYKRHLERTELKSSDSVLTDINSHNLVWSDELEKWVFLSEGRGVVSLEVNEDAFRVFVNNLYTEGFGFQGECFKKFKSSFLN